MLLLTGPFIRWHAGSGPAASSPPPLAAAAAAAIWTPLARRVSPALPLRAAGATAPPPPPSAASQEPKPACFSGFAAERAPASAASLPRRRAGCCDARVMGCP